MKEYISSLSYMGNCQWMSTPPIWVLYGYFAKVWVYLQFELYGHFANEWIYLQFVCYNAHFANEWVHLQFESYMDIFLIKKYTYSLIAIWVL